MRSEKKSHRSPLAISIIILIGVLIFSSISCKSPVSPEGGEADIVVYNNSGETLDIYLNGVFKFSSRHKSSIEIDDVDLGYYELEARERDTGIIYDSTEVDVTDYIDYTWTIYDPPDINVTNKFGKTLKIYLDGSYQFDLADEENRWILNVSYGERFLKAVKASDGQEVASVTIKVDENTDYSWTIEEITTEF